MSEWTREEEEERGRMSERVSEWVIARTLFPSSPLVMCGSTYFTHSQKKDSQRRSNSIDGGGSHNTEEKPYLCVYIFIHMYKFSSHQLLLMYTKGRKKGYTIEMTLSSTMLKEMAFRLHTGLRRNGEIHIKKLYDNSGGSSTRLCSGSGNGGGWMVTATVAATTAAATTPLLPHQ